MRRFNALFPLWAVLLSAVAFFADRQFAALEGAIVPLLALVMFMMGLTLNRADLSRIARNPVPVFIGVLLQFLLMPLAAFALADLLRLSPQLTAGLVSWAAVPALRRPMSSPGWRGAMWRFRSA